LVDYLYYPGKEIAFKEMTKANGCSLHYSSAYKPNGLQYCYDAEDPSMTQDIYSIRSEMDLLQ